MIKILPAVVFFVLAIAVSWLVVLGALHTPIGY